MNSAAAAFAPSPLALPAETQVVGHRMLVFAEVDSTNNRALSANGDGVVIVAETQTAGRGRHGRTWHSAPGLGLWFSIGILGATTGLTFAAALAVRDALAPFAALRVKWPNDLLLNGKKVCGILVEHRQGRTALGIGLNLAHTAADIPLELRETATSILIETGQRLERSDILKSILEHLDRRILALRGGGVSDMRREWSEACGIVGRQIRVQGALGTVRGVNDAGALDFVDGAGRSRWITAEVTELEHVT